MNIENSLVKQDLNLNEVVEKSDDLMNSLNEIISISTRFLEESNEGKVCKFYTFDKDKLNIVAKNMVEINRVCRCFGRKNTQVTNKLMTLTMLNDSSPYRILRQCIAQIENRRMALKENIFKILKDKIKLEKIKLKIDKLKLCFEQSMQHDDIALDLQLEQINYYETLTGISDSMVYIEGCFKDLASFQDAYNQVKKNNNIPDNWDELSFEEEEARFHTRQAILLAYKDVMQNGKLNLGTMEYLSQMGIHYHKVLHLIQDYINKCEFVIQTSGMKTKELDYNQFQKFLDDTADEFKNSYKQVLNKIGITDMINMEFLYRENLMKDNL